MWIEDYRRREGLELYELARKLNKYRREHYPEQCGTITDSLLYMLERDKNAVTHPLIANVIAEVCGATVEQRDMIVADIHKGTWEPEKETPVLRPKRVPIGAKPVVKIDRNRNIVGWFESVADASRRDGHNETVVRNRCKHRANYEFNSLFPYTYRYEDEWLKMTEEERIEDLGGEIIDKQ